MASNINYQHLFYFWNVVKEDSFTKASKKLGLAQPTISGQISTFEKSIGSPLLSREGRRIFLTETGHIVFNYAQKIFSLGEKMNDDIRNSTLLNFNSLSLGYRNSIPGQIIASLSHSIYNKDDNRLIFLMDNNEAILNGVARKLIDAAITDEPFSYINGVPLYNHLLIESDISLLGHIGKIEAFGNNLSNALQLHPCIMPSQNTKMRRLLDDWLINMQIEPKVIAEVESFDTIINMARDFSCFIFVPTIILNDIQERLDYRDSLILPKIKIRYYATTLAKQPDNKLISTIIDSSQTEFS